jgi:multicomponent Na+:H+ antiporter subunit A
MLAGRRVDRRVAIVCAVAPLAGFVWLLARLGDVADGGSVTEVRPWISSLDVDIAFRLDGYAALFALLVTGVGVLVFGYSARYLRKDDDAAWILGLLTLFAGSMLGLVLADDLLVLYGFWELTSIASYLLIATNHESPLARAAALQALLITSTGALAMLGGFVLIGEAAGTYRISELLADPPTGTTVAIGVVLVIVGALTKSAQYPFHSWLPAAMAAPTPVSAYLHSATMVKAGVFLVGRLAPAFVLVGAWRPLLATAGLVTMIAGGLRAFRQYDLKVLLAHGTVSQLGFMILLFGLGTTATITAGCALVLGHAVFKATLFMVVGILDHQTGTRDLRSLPPLGAGWGGVKVVTVLSAASMAGVPLVFGFVAKESALDALDHGGYAMAGLVLAAAVVGSAITAAYSIRFAWAVLHPRGEPGATPPPSPAIALAAPGIVLAAVTLVLGIAPSLADDLVGSASAPVHLAVWHGITPALAYSALVLTAGAALFLVRRRVAPVLGLGARVANGDDVFVAGLRLLNVAADRITAVVQSGSLRVYAGIILATAAGLTGGTLLLAGEWPGWPEAVATAGQVPVGLALVVLAIAAARGRRRFSSALLLGAVGYTMAALFIVQGAPDLAMTQVAIETLTTVLFVLVLRRLPPDFEGKERPSRIAVRVGVSALVASMVFAFAIASSQTDPVDAVSQDMIERAVPDGHGKNVVNVILVDFRGLDTLGEITVLSAGAIGAVALARAGRHHQRRVRE